MVKPRQCRTCPAVFTPYHGWRYCADCVANGRRDRDVTLRQRYGVFGLLAYEALMAKQGGKCANQMCDGEPDEVDHLHSCCPGYQTTCGKCVRWLLCGSCNRAEGWLRSERRALGLALMIRHERSKTTA